MAGVAVGASPLAPASPVVYAGLSTLANQVINSTLPPPQHDPGFNPGDILDQGRDDSYAAYDYLTAMIANGRIPDGADEFLAKERPYPYAPFELTVYEDGHPMLKPIRDLGGGERDRLTRLLGSEDDGIGGEEFEAYWNHYDASGSYRDAVARDAGAHRLGLR